MVAMKPCFRQAPGSVFLTSEVSSPFWAIKSWFKSQSFLEEVNATRLRYTVVLASVIWDDFVCFWYLSAWSFNSKYGPVFLGLHLEIQYNVRTRLMRFSPLRKLSSNVFSIKKKKRKKETEHVVFLNLRYFILLLLLLLTILWLYLGSIVSHNIAILFSFGSFSHSLKRMRKNEYFI